ncbi:MAG: hypothetical protein ACOX7W_08465 [Christensenellales bacterium]|jgi:hypothetical protein
MPLPTIHLLVTEAVAHRTGMGLSGKCLLGSIAPDAIHMRKGSTLDDKHNTHLRTDGLHKSWETALSMLRDCRRDPFVTGYALHVMTDYLWILGPWREFTRKLPEGLSSDEIKRIYYRDMNHIDNWLFRQAGSRRLWDALLKAPPTAMPQYVSLGEVSAWRRNRYVRLLDERRSQPAGYITLDTARRFINETGQRLAGPVQEALSGRKEARDVPQNEPESGDDNDGT